MTLKIALLGYGKMGREVEAAAENTGHKIVARYNRQHPLADASWPKADVLIDFSHPEAVLRHVQAAVQHDTPLVIGTTGWYDRIDEARRMAETGRTGVLYASNFSLGMNVFMKIVELAARLFDKLPAYDPYLHELHHRGKVDSPSGTALSLAEIVLGQISRKNKVAELPLRGAIAENELHVASTRAGNIPGTHVVGFDSEADTIELKHTARSRRGFALGALYAAEWIVGHRGWFTLDDLLRERLGLEPRDQP